MDPLQHWVEEIYLLIGILTAATIGFVLIILSWTGIKVAIFRMRQRRGESQDRRKRFDSNGQPRPPRAAGVCDVCGAVFAELNFLEGNRRLCDECIGQDAIARTGGGAGAKPKRTHPHALR